MKEAIREHVEREEARESFRQEALEAWRTYCESGRHLTLKETEAWLKAWGKEDETEAPRCHE